MGWDSAFEAVWVWSERGGKRSGRGTCMYLMPWKNKIALPHLHKEPCTWGWPFLPSSLSHQEAAKINYSIQCRRVCWWSIKDQEYSNLVGQYKVYISVNDNFRQPFTIHYYVCTLTNDNDSWPFESGTACFAESYQFLSYISVYSCPSCCCNCSSFFKSCTENSTSSASTFK